MAIETEVHRTVTAETPVKKAPIMIFAIIVVVALGALLAFGILPRIARHEDLKHTEDVLAAAVPPVHVIVAKKAPNLQELLLPASIQAIQDIPIYARTDGYLKKRFVDIGDRVKTGQLLATIETPELDKQLQQAKSDVVQSKANLESSKADEKQAVANFATAKANVVKAKADLIFAKTEVVRYNELAGEGAVSFEQKDSRVRDVQSTNAALDAVIAAQNSSAAQISAARQRIAVAQAAVKSAQANVERLESLVSFEDVKAPADGVITARNVDAGALISSGSGSANLELLRMVRTNILRVYVYVPQASYQGIYVGQQAQILVAEYPDRVFIGTVKHVAGALDPVSRTMQTEVHIPNPDNVLKPGTYAQVKFITNVPNPPVLLPSGCLVTEPDGEYVARLSKPDNVVHYQQVQIGRDYGRVTEIASGIKDGDTVVVDPSDDLREGAKVAPKLKDMSVGDAPAAASKNMIGPPGLKMGPKPKSLMESSPLGNATPVGSPPDQTIDGLGSKPGGTPGQSAVNGTTNNLQQVPFAGRPQASREPQTVPEQTR